MLSTWNISKKPKKEQQNAGVVRDVWTTYPMTTYVWKYIQMKWTLYFIGRHIWSRHKKQKRFFWNQIGKFAPIRCSRIWLRRIRCNCICIFLLVYAEGNHCNLDGTLTTLWVHFYQMWNLLYEDKITHSYIYNPKALGSRILFV